MPIAIVVSRGETIPAVIQEQSQDALLDALRGLSETPEITSVTHARTWLRTLPAPSGWFETMEEAQAMAQALKDAKQEPPLSGHQVREARGSLGLDRAAFAEAIGYGGNSNTRHKNIFEIEGEVAHRTTGKVRTLTPDATARLRVLLAEAQMKTQ